MAITGDPLPCHTYYPGAGGKTGVVELREERRHLGYR